jgi:uncharacterized membrane protein YjfL (UPF0719 family)
MWELLTLFTPVAYADVDTFVLKLNKYIFNPIIMFMVTLAVAYFLFGIYEYIKGSSSDEAREKGQRHMIWGLIGLAIMVSVFFIMKVLLGTIGIDETEINVETGQVNFGSTINGETVPGGG